MPPLALGAGLRPGALLCAGVHGAEGTRQRPRQVLQEDLNP